MVRKYNAHYDEEFDRLMIAGKSESDVIAGSLRILNLILDFNSENKVVNAELLHASEYLKSLNMNVDLLNKITGGSLSYRALRNGYEIVFILEIGEKIVPVSYNVHLPNQKQILVTSS